MTFGVRGDKEEAKASDKKLVPIYHLLQFWSNHSEGD